MYLNLEFGEDGEGLGDVGVWVWRWGDWEVERVRRWDEERERWDGKTDGEDIGFTLGLLGVV